MIAQNALVEALNSKGWQYKVGRSFTKVAGFQGQDARGVDAPLMCLPILSGPLAAGLSWLVQDASYNNTIHASNQFTPAYASIVAPVITIPP